MAAISVKSMINKAAIQDAANSAERLRTMPRQSLLPDLETINPELTQSPRPAVFLFGFQGPELETMRQHTREACQGAGSPKVLSGVFVLDKGFVAPVSANGNVSVRDIQGYRIGHTREGVWGGLLALLWDSLTSLTIIPSVPNMLAHIRAGDLLDPPAAGDPGSGSETAGPLS